MCRLDASLLFNTHGQELQRVTESLLQLHSRTAFCSSPLDAIKVEFLKKMEREKKDPRERIRHFRFCFRGRFITDVLLQ